MEGRVDWSVKAPLNATPALRKDVTISPQLLGLEPCYVMEDALRSKFYRIGVREFTFISLLDGKTSLGAALGAAATVLGPDALSEQDALAIVGWLADCQLISAHAGIGACDDKRPAATEAVLRDPLFIKLPLFNPDPWLDKMLPWLGGLLSAWFLAVWVLVVGCGGYYACAEWIHLVDSTFVILDPANWLRLTIAWLCLSVWHEAFHALACKKYGGSVPRAGIALLCFVPAAFVDVTSCWRFRSKRQRIITAAAGIYAELFVAGAALILWANSAEGILHRFCYDLAIMAGLATLLVNGNPLLRFDGYYILSDLVDVPNLATRARQCVGYLAQRYICGFEALPPPCPPGRVAFVRVYAVAALLWRIALAVTLVLTVIGMFSYLGAILVVFCIAIRFWRPMAAKVRRGFLGGLPTGRKATQWALFAAGVVLLAGWWLTGPGIVTAPAIVEYAPLTVVRAVSPGFVSQVLVHDGEQAQAGQILVVLVNDELQAKLADLTLAAQQTLIRGRSYQQDHNLPKCQIERFELESLEKQRAEAEQQVAALTIRAPSAGKVVGRKLATLVGQYLAPGAEIAVLGNEQAKELVIAVPQDDVDPFTSHIGQKVNVRVRGAGDGRFESLLSKVEPRAVVECPHPAMSARAGGPLPVKAQPVKAQPATETSADPSLSWELLTPVFTGKVPLSASESLRWHPGQLSTVSFQSAGESRWQRFGRGISHWVEQRVEQARQK